MSTFSETRPPVAEAAEVIQTQRIHKAMSISNMLVEPTAVFKKDETATMDSASTPFSFKYSESSPSVSLPETAITDTHDGSSDEASEEDVPDEMREFICVNDRHTRCRTGQYTKDLSRKVISDHFGRNKACTRNITEWPLFCRKHYQRATYNKEKWQIRKIQLILRQLDAIEKQFPGTTYDVTLKKSEENRLNQYSRHIASGLCSSAAQKRVAPAEGKHFEAPIDVLRELDQWLGKGKSRKEVKEIVDILLQMLEGKECEQVPAIEFLPKLPGKVVSSKKAPAESPVKGRTATSARVSKKGGVKKTTKKA